MSYTPKTDINGKCIERVPCSCGQGYASAYDGYCGHCRKSKNQRNRGRIEIATNKNHKCQICEHRNDCTLKEEYGL